MTKGRQLHPDQGLEGHHLKRTDAIRRADVGCRDRISGTYFLAREENVDGVAILGARAVQERVDAFDLAENETGAREGGLGRF